MNGRGHVVALALMFSLAVSGTAVWAASAQNGACLPAQSTLDPSEFRGFFEGPLGGGATATGVTGMTGWVVAVNGVQHVQILVDNIAAQDAQYGQNRPGISDLFPGFPDGDHVGFGVLLDSARFTNGNHVVNILVTTNDGRQTLLNGRTIQFTNSDHLLAPFGDLFSPPENANLIGRCNLGDPNRFLTAFVGFALDTGVTEGHLTVGWVELLLDGVIYRNTRRDCHLDVAAGGLADCYGITRHETSTFYPTLADTPNSGYRFLLDLGDLITRLGISEGQHEIIVRSGDTLGQQTNIARIPVNIFCLEDFTNFDSFGDIEVGEGPVLVGGTVNIHGWALDLEAISVVRVLIDGTFVGNASYGFERPGVTMLYPSFPNSAAPGFQFLLDTTTLTNGPHSVVIEVQDVIGTRTVIGERHFKVFNPVAP
jgi:N-acetylmuramoyl-L-alanine amidase